MKFIFKVRCVFSSTKIPLFTLFFSSYASVINLTFFVASTTQQKHGRVGWGGGPRSSRTVDSSARTMKNNHELVWNAPFN